MKSDRLPVLIAGAAFVLVALLCSSCDQLEPDDPSLSNDERYSLFTWNSDGARICFALIVRSQRGNFLRHWFPKRAGKCGVVDLKIALNDLPNGTEVLWEELPRRGFVFPSGGIMDEVMESAKKNNVHLVYAPILDQKH